MDIFKDTFLKMDQLQYYFGNFKPSYIFLRLHLQMFNYQYILKHMFLFIRSYSNQVMMDILQHTSKRYYQQKTSIDHMLRHTIFYNQNNQLDNIEHMFYLYSKRMIPKDNLQHNSMQYYQQKFHLNINRHIIQCHYLYIDLSHNLKHIGNLFYHHKQNKVSQDIKQHNFL